MVFLGVLNVCLCVLDHDVDEEYESGCGFGDVVLSLDADGYGVGDWSEADDGPEE